MSTSCTAYNFSQLVHAIYSSYNELIYSHLHAQESAHGRSKHHTSRMPLILTFVRSSTCGCPNNEAPLEHGPKITEIAQTRKSAAKRAVHVLRVHLRAWFQAIQAKMLVFLTGVSVGGHAIRNVPRARDLGVIAKQPSTLHLCLPPTTAAPP
jgi:hypothetical protein